MYITICKIDDLCKLDALKQGTQKPVPGTTQKDGVGRGGRGFRGGGATCILVADSCFFGCVARTITIL